MVSRRTLIENMNPDDLARHAVRLLKRRGFQAFLVGGCVRDLLLGRKPKDWDVATNATPDQILALFPSSNLVGAQFGVVRVREDAAEVEVATFRSDGEYDDGRRPRTVKYETDPREDALRRDFTINALFLDPDTDEILDFVEGRADLGAGIVRAIGAPRERFREDHLRLLRAIRFAASLQFRIAPATWAAIRAMADTVHGIAAERVRDELTRILTEGGARAGFELLDGCDLLRELLPEVAAMKGVEQPPQFHPEGDVWTHTLLLLEKLDHPSVPLAWGALLHDVGKPATFRITDRIRFDGHVEVGVEIARGILNRLRFSREDADQVLSLIANHMKFKDAAAMKESTLKRFVRQPAFDEHLELHRIDCLSSNGQLGSYELVKRRLAEYSVEQLKPEPLVTGTDLIDWGYDPGPKFTLILATVEDAQLDGTVRTPEEARRLVEARFQKDTL
jgi:poly(A) polymerase